MNSSRAQFGQQCENWVSAYAESVLGWTVLASRVKFRAGEIDLIFKTPHHRLMLVEVKGRQSSRFGSGLEALTGRKRDRFFRAALEYVHRNRVREEWQLWCVAVNLEPHQNLPTLEWVRME